MVRLASQSRFNRIVEQDCKPESENGDNSVREMKERKRDWYNTDIKFQVHVKKPACQMNGQEIEIARRRKKSNENRRFMRV